MASQGFGFRWIDSVSIAKQKYLLKNNRNIEVFWQYFLKIQKNRKNPFQMIESVI